jgi:CheY-like chemotaxis protein
VKADPRARVTRILAMSGHGGEHAREQILGAGADGFLEKPIGLEALQAEVARLLARAAG